MIRERDSEDPETDLNSVEAKDQSTKRITFFRSAKDRFMKFFNAHPFLTCIITAVVINSIIESASRHSVFKHIGSIINSPFVFVYSVMIILLTLLLSLLFRKRFFVYFLISAVWLILGIVNGLVLLFRVTPLTGTDFTIVWSVLGVIEVYLTPVQIVAICIAIMLFVGLVVYIALKSPRTKALIAKGVLSLCVMGIAVVIATGVGLKAGAITDVFGNLAEAYENYGFAYCFTRSIIDTGIDRPDSYEDEISDLADELGQATATMAAGSGDSYTSATQATPNVIYLQIESFFDAEQLNNYEYSEDPIPNFRKLKENYPSGYLSVPAIGAGTANTEFEILTGMNLDYFGTCEYPYKTVLKEIPTESICRNLANHGYATHAIHNNDGTFYQRDLVFASLGFDTFTSVEYMKNVEYNDIGWVKDSILTEEILLALNSTEEQDFLFTISVQAHGKYPRIEPDVPYDIAVTGGKDEGLTNAVEYYVNEIADVDVFLGELIDTLSHYDEPVMLVLYGDHLPSLEIEASELESGDLFKAEYVLWTNYELEVENKNLNAWELSAHVMDILDLSGGPIVTLHNDHADDKNYLGKLELLQYDILYGDQVIFGGENPYQMADTKMGVLDITMTSHSNPGDDLQVRGTNFTEFSVIFVNGRRCETEYISDRLLMVRDKNVDDRALVEVAQLTGNNEELSRVAEVREINSNVD